MTQSHRDWPPGTRVRCVEDAGLLQNDPVKIGREFVVEADARYVRLEGHRGGYMRHRFKPVVRVKAPSRPDIATLFRKAAAAYAAMTPEQQRAHRATQRRSWVIGETMLSHPEMSRADAEALFDRVCPC